MASPPRWHTPPESAVLRLVARGHPQVTATHAKTLELTAADAVTRRASCVLGVGVRVTAGPAAGIAGPVLIRIGAGRTWAEVSAVANPDWRPGGPAVVRRSPRRLAHTLATDADAAAADLPRGLVEAATDPASRVVAEVHRLARRPDGRAGVVLLWAQPQAPAPDRLAAELAAADVVLAEDVPAADLLATLDVRPDPTGDDHPVAVDLRSGRTVDPAAVAGDVLAGDTGRVLAVATQGLPGSGLATLLARPDAVAVEVAGLPPECAAAAASPRRGPVYLAGRVRRGEFGRLLRSVPAECQLTCTVAAERLPELLSLAAAERGTATVVLADPEVPGWARWGPVGAAVPDRRGGEVTCCLDGTEPATGLDERLAGLTRALLADGVPASSLARALARQPGWSRSRAYQEVHRLREPTGR